MDRQPVALESAVICSQVLQAIAGVEHRRYHLLVLRRERVEREARLHRDRDSIHVRDLQPREGNVTIKCCKTRMSDSGDDPYPVESSTEIETPLLYFHGVYKYAYMPAF
jgi:hypothetical protein